MADFVAENGLNLVVAEVLQQPVGEKDVTQVGDHARHCRVDHQSAGVPDEDFADPQPGPACSPLEPVPQRAVAERPRLPGVAEQDGKADDQEQDRSPADGHAPAAFLEAGEPESHGVLDGQHREDRDQQDAQVVPRVDRDVGPATHAAGMDCHSRRTDW